MRVLGLSAFYHDSAAALVEDGRIVAAAQEERFTRKKFDAGYPRLAIDYCLSAGNIKLKDVDRVVFYDKPFIKFERLLETYLTYSPRGFTSFRMALPLWLREKLFQKSLLTDELKAVEPDFDWSGSPDLLRASSEPRSLRVLSRRRSTKAAVLTLDGVGEWTTTAVAIGEGKDLEIHKEIHFPHSLGLLYSAFTYYTGFKVNSGEYKLMGLAPYGTPKYEKVIRDNLIDLKPDGSFRLNLDYFNYCTGLTMTNERFDALFGAPPRNPETWLEQKHMDIAASIQAVLEDVVLRLTRGLAAETGMRESLSCRRRGAQLRRQRQGAARRPLPQHLDPAGRGRCRRRARRGARRLPYPRRPRTRAAELDRRHGRSLSWSRIRPARHRQASDGRRRAICDRGRATTCSTRPPRRSRTARRWAGSRAAWSSGRARSAIARSSAIPRSPTMQKNLNLKVKYRESFRPFAPSVLREHVADWFDLDVDSPYMLLVAPVAERHMRQMTAEEEALFGIDKLNVARSTIPAVTHVDYSARVQTVHRETNPLYHDLISRFHGLTGCPVVINTSFNVRSEPIVCTPEDAFRCFMGTELDLLVVGNSILRKEDQDPALKIVYKDKFELD